MSCLGELGDLRKSSIIGNIRESLSNRYSIFESVIISIGWYPACPKCSYIICFRLLFLPRNELGYGNQFMKG